MWNTTNSQIKIVFFLKNCFLPTLAVKAVKMNTRPSIHLSPRDLDASCERLSLPPRRQTPCGVLLPKDIQRPMRRLERTDIERSVDRLYRLGSRPYSALSPAVAKLGPCAVSKKLSEHELRHAVDRLHDDACKRRESIRAMSKKKYLAQDPIGAREPNPYRSADEKAAELQKVQHSLLLYENSKELEKEKELRLKRMYIDGSLPQGRPRSREDWNETVNRLYVVKRSNNVQKHV